MSARHGYRGSLAERFDRLTIPEPNSGCLLWLGSVNQHGYGQMRVDRRSRQATHIALELSGRSVPKGMRACHRCDNPFCVNEEHLFIGSQADNVADMVAKKRDDFSGLGLGRGHQKTRTHCRRGHSLSGENLIIRPNGGRPFRECRICGRANRLAWKRRRQQ